MCAERAIMRGEEVGCLFRNETEHTEKLTPIVCIPSGVEWAWVKELGVQESDKVPSSALSQQQRTLCTQEDPAFRGWVTWITGIVVQIIMNSQNLSKPTSRHMLSPYPQSFPALWLSRKEELGLSFWKGGAAGEWATGILAIALTQHCSLFLDLFMSPSTCGKSPALQAWLLHRLHSCCVQWGKDGPETLAPHGKQLGYQWTLNALEARHSIICWNVIRDLCTLDETRYLNCSPRRNCIGEGRRLAPNALWDQCTGLQVHLFICKSRAQQLPEMSTLSSTEAFTECLV